MKNVDLSNIFLLETVLRQVFPDIIFPGEDYSPDKVRVVLADCNYEDNKDWIFGAGIAWARRHLSTSKEPVLIIGYDREEIIRKSSEGSLLDVDGVEYVRLPIGLKEIRAAIEILRHKEAEGLDLASAERNITDFQRELRSDFCHGAFGSIQRNFEGALTHFNEKRYDNAAKQLRLNLERYERGKASLRRIGDKYQFPLSQRVVLEIDELLKNLAFNTQQAIASFESDPSSAKPFLTMINEKVMAIETLINNTAPKV